MSTSRTTGGAGTAPEGALGGPDPPERSSVVTSPRLEGFDQGDGAGDEQDAADRLEQARLREPPGQARPEQGPRDRRRGPDSEQPPVHPTGSVTHHPRSTDPETDREVRADSPRRDLPEPADHRGHPEAP